MESPNQALDDPVTNSINSGVTYVASAGNHYGDACDESPSRTTVALTVGATDINDAAAAFSNSGPCIDIYAPGVGVKSGYAGDDMDWAYLDGTSMAAPHVTGVAALYLENASYADPITVASRILNAGTSGLITSLPANSPNFFLHNGIRNISLQSVSGHCTVEAATWRLIVRALVYGSALM